MKGEMIMIKYSQGEIVIDLRYLTKWDSEDSLQLSNIKEFKDYLIENSKSGTFLPDKVIRKDLKVIIENIDGAIIKFTDFFIAYNNTVLVSNKILWIDVDNEKVRYVSLVIDIDSDTISYKDVEY